MTKKTYTKPAVSFESFELASSIAQNCAVQLILATEGVCPNHGTQSQPTNGCAIYDNGYAVFLDFTSCQVTADMMGLCYDIPTDSNRSFIS